jgi:NTP pyrophosphatase (non-canonical NTP hydrolase)
MRDTKYRSLFKLAEECGELVQVLGKIGVFPEGDHPDGRGHLHDRVKDEIADVAAALQYFMETHHFEFDHDRYQYKLKQFRERGLCVEET